MGLEKHLLFHTSDPTKTSVKFFKKKKKLHDRADKMMYIMNNKFLKGFGQCYLLDNYNL